MKHRGHIIFYVLFIFLSRMPGSVLAQEKETREKRKLTILIAPPNTTVISVWSHFRFKFPEKIWRKKIYSILKEEQRKDKSEYIYFLVSYRNFSAEHPYDPQTFRLADDTKKIIIPLRYFIVAWQNEIGKSSKYRVDLYLYKFKKELADRYFYIFLKRKEQTFLSNKPFFSYSGVTLDMVRPYK